MEQSLCTISFMISDGWVGDRGSCHCQDGLRLLDPVDLIAHKLNGNEGCRMFRERSRGWVEENNLEKFWTLQMTVKMHGTTEGLLELVPFICFWCPQ
jgi:hypothetical protein